MSGSEPLLEVKNVTKVFSTGGLLKKGVLKAVDNVSFDISGKESKIICLAGESGSGKSTIANMVLDLVEPTAGEVKYNGKDIHRMTKHEYQTYRREVQAIFQDPFGTFNPFYRVSRVLKKPIKQFRLASSQGEEMKKIDEALTMVGLSSEEVLDKYPHQLSGGQRQRIMLGRMFLIRSPVVVADEPTSMIDTSLRAEILDIMLEFKKKYGVSFLYITHDLSVANYLSEEIMIIYLGEIIERGRTDAIIGTPRHPYTQLLVSSIPLPNPKKRWSEKMGLEAADTEHITSYTLTEAPPGCKFYDRCLSRMDLCKDQRPPVVTVEPNHQATCFLYEEKK